MVFESVVSNLLNTFLGDYVENLDASQLNIGIWGGDVVLNNLNIKATALDNLDLPVKLKSGFLAKLTLKIPWKNLYTEPVIAEIEGLYVLVVPNIGIVYDADKENKQAQDTKQAELKKIDDARKAKKKKDEKPADDTFTEKLVTQVIKNLQVTVKNIHIRYEDQYTNRKRPFALGVTLHSLYFQTTDEHWNPMIIKEQVKLIYKLIDLDSMSFYWNSDARLISELNSTDEIRDAMKEMVATKDFRPKDFTYILAPISISAKLRLNQKPETDGTNFTTPKVLLTLSIEEIGMNMGKYQYQDILEFLEAQERLTLNAKYRKYRPNLRDYKGHYKEWWHFAMTCILEDTVKRKNRNWSWQHIKDHRAMVRNYKNAWIEKLTVKSPTKETLATIEAAEKQLDVFNLNVGRQQAELEDQQGWIGWATSWWSGGGNKPKKDDDITSQFEKAMTPDERAKMYEALDYKENQPPTQYPKEFVENKILFSLTNLSIVVHDDVAKGQRVEVVTVSLQRVSADIQQRPAAQAIRIEAKMHTFKIEGIKEGDQVAPVIASTAVKLGGSVDLPQLAAFIETNPMDNSCDQFVQLRVLPQNIIYHAPSINKLAVVFRPPESVRLKQLTAAAFAKYEDIKVRSATGLAYAMEKRSRLKLDIELLPCCVQIPETGVLTKSSSVLVIDLGHLRLSTVDTGDLTLDESFYQKSEDAKLEELMTKAYDVFKIELKSLQVLFASPRDDWQAARSQKKSQLHVLNPTGFEIVLNKASIVDLRIPSMRVNGNLPDLHLNISDLRLLCLLKLLMSIPTPPPVPPGEVSTIEDIIIPEPDLKTKAKMHAIMEENDAELTDSGDGVQEKTTEVMQAKQVDQQAKEQQVAVDMKLVLNQVCVNVSRVVADVEQPYITFGLRAIGVDFKMRALDMVAKVVLGGVELEHRQFKAFDGKGPLFIIGSQYGYDPEKPLLQVEYVQADKKSPFFATDYGSVEQLIRIFSEPLVLSVHQEALVDIQNFGQTLSSELAKIKPPAPPPPPVKTTESSGGLKRQTSHMSTISLKSISMSLSDQRKKRLREAAAKLDEHIINMKLVAALNGVDIVLGSSKCVLNVIKANGLDAEVIMRPKTMHVELALRSIGITDPNPGVKYGQIMTVAGKEVFHLDFVQFNRTDEEKKQMTTNEFDMGVTLRFAEMRFVFLNLWVNNLMAWLTPFQEATAAAASASAAAMSQSATDAVDILSQHQLSKIKLDVTINAPIVIMPQNSRSDEAVLVHFGNLSVANKFNGYHSKGGTELAIVDELAVKLTDMKLARVILGSDGWTVVAECRMLDPVTFMLAVARNLSFDWFKEKPEITIYAKLPHLKITASQEDYGLLMRILNENLAEGAPPPKAAVAAPPKTDVAPIEAAPAVETPISSDSEKAKLTVPVETHGGEKAAPSSGVASKLEFEFAIEEISAFLYTGSSNLLEGVAQRDNKKAFAGIQISQINVKGCMRDDTSMNADVILHSLIMDDCREGRIGITRLMDKKGDAPQAINVLDVIYRKQANGDQRADIKMRPFFFCVCPEFLGALAQFFTAAGPKSAEETSAAPEPATRQASAAKKPVAKAAQPQAAAPAPGVMDICIEVEDPEIILIEDASKPDSTQAVILQFKTKIAVKQVSGEMAISGGITDLEIFSSFYNPTMREKNKKHVLNPCEFNVQGKMMSDGGQQFNIEITDIIMQISPSVIRLLSAVSAGMAAPQEESIRDKKAKITARKHVWDVKKVKELLSAEEATETTLFEELPPETKPEQQLMLELNKFVFTLEADAGAGTVPMILLKSSFTAEVQNWSSELEVDANMTLVISYFNEQFNVWEPLIEPCEMKNGAYRPWELTMNVKSQSEFDVPDDEEQILLPPKMAIGIVSTDVMNITLSKTCLDMLTKLGDAFNKAAKMIPPTKSTSLELTAPYVVSNEAGLGVEIMASESLELPPKMAGKMLPYSDYIPLVNKIKALDFRSMEAQDEYSNDFKLNIRLPEMNTVREVDVSRAEKRIFSIPKVTHPGDQWQMLVDISSHYGKKLIAIRSILKVKNNLPLPVEVYYLNDTNLESCGIVDADGELSLPMAAVYTPTGELFFRPIDDKYETSKPALNWRTFKENPSTTTSILQCGSTSLETKAMFYMQVWAEMETAFFENTNRKNLSSFCYTIHLRPPVTFHNVLPYPIEIIAPKIPQAILLKSGESTSLYSVCPGQSSIEIKVLSNDSGWTCRTDIDETCEELRAITFTSKRENNTHVEMDLGIRTTTHQGSRDMSLYCPFWMVNKTGLPIAYKDESLQVAGPGGKKTRKSQSCPCINSAAASGKNLGESEVVELPTEHPADVSDPILFTFNGKHFFDKKKACLKVGESEWSEKFPVDTVGSAGRIICKTKNGRDVEVSLTIQLSNSGLTKICTFTPFYMIDNRCGADIEIFEHTNDNKWISIPQTKCVPFWPSQSGKTMMMAVRYAGTKEESLSFPFHESFEAFVPIHNEYVGIDVCCHITEGSVVIEIADYQDGMAPALIVNATDSYPVMYTQDEIDNWQTLAPGTCVMFKWERMSGKRSLVWSCGEKKNVKDGLFKDGTGDFSADKGTDSKAYWVSFLDGRQRVLLFTEDLAIATLAQAYEAERIDQQITLSMKGIGVSLVNNHLNAEVAFIGIMSSGLIWEYKKKRYKAMSVKECRELESAYTRYQTEKMAGKKNKSRQMVDKMDVDFDLMMQYKPSERQMRRSFQTGVWLQYKLSVHQQHLHLKLNHFQVDNQLPACVFPIVFAPVPPAKSVAAESIPKPWCEVSFVQRKAEHSTVPQIKYFKVLVQEMSVQADQGFINAMLAFFGGDEGVSLYSTDLYRKDREITQQDLSAYASITSSTEQKAFYDELHFSPIKVHLSFSQGGASGEDSSKKSMQIHSEFLNLLLKSVGVTLTEIQDVVFKLAYFERTAVFLNRPQLISEVTQHYTKQAIKQLYVLVLGLDIIGNPFGLIRDLSTGVETLFYEPIQGAIQGPEEFAEGLALGVKSLFGHAVGGAAGAVSRITGTLGKGLAALTMDDEYQKKRQEMMNRRPANVREGFMQGGKGLVMGVYDGVTGVFLKPIEGAKSGGFSGFAKGVGKGLVGVVARPASGLADFASSSFESVKKVTDVSTEVKKLRQPRYLHPDKIVRAYSTLEAEGNQMLQAIDKGKYSSTDNYVAFAPLTKDKLFYVFVTDKRIMLISKNELFGNMEVDWSYTWTELECAPTLGEKGLQVKLKEPKKKVLGLFGHSSGGKLVHFPDEQTGKWIAEKCDASFRAEMGS